MSTTNRTFSRADDRFPGGLASTIHTGHRKTIPSETNPIGKQESQLNLVAKGVETLVSRPARWPDDQVSQQNVG